MQIAKLQIDRFGAWTDLALGPLSSGVNVYWGQETAHRAALVEFIRSVLFGFNDQVRAEYLTPGSRDAGGSLALNVPAGLQIVHRHDAGDRYGRLIVEGEHGPLLGSQRLESLTGGIPQSVFDRIFTIDFHQRSGIEALIDAAAEQGFPVIGGHGDETRLEPLRQRLAEQRRLLADLTAGDLSLNGLLERRRRLRMDIEALQAAAQQHADRDGQQRRKLQAELVELEQQLDELHAELQRLDAEIETRGEERQRRAAEVQQMLFERQQGVIQRRQQLAEADKQLERWRQVLSDVEIRRERLQADQETGGFRDDGPADPRHPLRQLEEQVEHLHATMLQLDPGNDPNACVCRQLRSQLTPTLHAMREGIYHLCNQLNLWEASARRTESGSELGQMRRCEAELRQAIQALSLRRQQLLAELSSMAPQGHTLRAAHAELCRCADHPSDLDWAVSTDPQQPGLDEELLSVLDAELDRLQQRRRNVLADIDEVEHELNELRQRLERGPAADESDPLRQRLEAKQAELQRIERQICDGEKRRDVHASIAEMESEIRALEAATQPSEILREASTLLRQASCDELQQIAVTPERIVRVQHRSGARLSLADLKPGQRDQVHLSLDLAIVAAFGRRGTHLPLILHDPLLRQDGPHAEAVVSALNDFAARGHQILLLLGSAPAAQLFRARGTSVRQLPNPREILLPAVAPAAVDLSEQKRQEINRQLNAIAEEANRAAAAVSYPAFSAEEFPGELTDRVRGARLAEPEPADSQNASEYFLLESSPIHEAPSIDAATAERFRKIGVLYVRDLLRIDIEDAAQRLRHTGITAAMIRSWRAEALLVCRVARLRPYDARILVACGIESPKQLARLDADELRRRVESFSATSTGQVLLRAGNRYELSRLTNWIQSARSSDPPRYGDNGQDRSTSARAERPYRERSAEQQAHDRGERRRRELESGDRRPSRRSRDRSSVPGLTREHHQTPQDGQSSPRGERNGRARVREADTRQDRDAVVLKLDREGDSLRFYLNTADPIENAPSIGPRTAERLQRIGIRTVADFLRADPEATAERLRNRHIKSDTIRQWQKQTILVCRVPQLRGHDAQILVACGILDPEKLAAIEPAALWQRVEPFAETNEGKRIIRSGKAPDLEEVRGWIACAAQARPLRAA